MIVNGVYWCVGLEQKIPRNGAKVELVGEYNPIAFKAQAGDYWKKKGIRPSAFKME